MALFSVWNWDRNAWAVYQNGQTVSVGDDPKPPRPSNVSPLGACPDTQVNPLPPDARFVGFDHACRGEVRRLGDSVGDALGLVVPESGDLKKYALGGLAGALLVWCWRRR